MCKIQICTEWQISAVLRRSICTMNGLYHANTINGFNGFDCWEKKFSNQLTFLLFCIEVCFKRDALNKSMFTLLYFMHSRTHSHTHACTHTHRFTILLILSGTTGVSQYQKTFIYSHLSWSSIILYLLPPIIAIHGILPVQSNQIKSNLFAQIYHRST